MNSVRFDKECHEFEMQAFYKALKGGDLGKVREICSRNGDHILLEKFRINAKEMTPLEIAAENGHEDIILFLTDDCDGVLDKDCFKQALLRCAGSSEITAHDGLACLLAHVKYVQGDLDDAIKRCPDKGKRRLLMQYGAKPSATCILDAIEQDDLPTIQKYMRDGHATLEMTFNFGADNMLSMSAMYEARSVFAFLISRGACPEYKMNGHSVMDRLHNYNPGFQAFARKAWDDHKKALIDTAGIITEEISDNATIKIHPKKVALRL
jgi:hypothetical protein